LIGGSRLLRSRRPVPRNARLRGAGTNAPAFLLLQGRSSNDNDNDK
jgi:hypothetical protein